MRWGYYKRVVPYWNRNEKEYSSYEWSNPCNQIHRLLRGYFVKNFIDPNVGNVLRSHGLVLVHAQTRLS